MRCEKNDRTESVPLRPTRRWKGKGERKQGRGCPKRFGLVRDTKATCSRSFQLSVKVQASGVRKPPANFFECPEPGSHRPRCPLCSYCDRISALFLPELQNVLFFQQQVTLASMSSEDAISMVRSQIRPIKRFKY